VTKFFRLTAAAAAVLAGVTTSSIARADAFLLNYEAPGVQHSTATFSAVGVETFDGRAVGKSSGFTTDFGTNGAITGVYSGPNGVQINPADQYGGAGGAGNYIVAFINDPYTVRLTASPSLDPQGVNYFGYWLSALDVGNVVTFYKAGVEVGQLTPAEVSSVTTLNRAYYGNPNANYHGQDGSEPFVFINFYDTTGTFDRITFSEAPVWGGGYESDNHTVGYYTQMGGVSAPSSAVPEPATWVLMLVGFAAFSAVGVRRAGKREHRSAFATD
jgi:PEP-CTERM motif